MGAAMATDRSLGSPAKHVDTRGRRDRRRSSKTKTERWSLTRIAAQLVPEQRVAHCFWTPTGVGSSVDVLIRNGEARFQGLQTCGSVWACPVCGARINEVRRQELHQLQRWARSRGYVVLLLTLTARHHEGMNLSWLLAAMRDAKRALRQSRSWRALREDEGGSLRGAVTALEVTIGDAGWHPHFHELLILECEDEASGMALVEGLRAEWLRSLDKKGLSGAGAAFDVRGGSQASRYVAKFGEDEAVIEEEGEASVSSYGLPEEMTMSRVKRGRRGGRSPMQLLRDAKEGDEEAGRLWAVYARAFRGKQQLTWSNGLKAAAGVGEVEDEQAAAPEAFDEEEDEVVVCIPIPVWKHMRHHYRVEILEAAEDGGAEAVHRLLWLHAMPPPDG